MPEIDFTCGVCGAATDIAPELPERAVCPKHCPDHQYERDPLAGYKACVNCGQPMPEDWR